MGMAPDEIAQRLQRKFYDNERDEVVLSGEELEQFVYSVYIWKVRRMSTVEELVWNRVVWFIVGALVSFALTGGSVQF